MGRAPSLRLSASLLEKDADLYASYQSSSFNSFPSIISLQELRIAICDVDFKNMVYVSVILFEFEAEAEALKVRRQSRWLFGHKSADDWYIA